MESKDRYPIGTLNEKWNDKDKEEWLSQQVVKRLYKDEVISKLNALSDSFEIKQYGALSYNPEKYPLFIAKTSNWQSSNPNILITGGVHGYETSGVQGALRFMQAKALEYSDRFNILIAPCVSPWGYETINRWNPFTVDPNRSFKTDGEAEEALLLMHHINDLNLSFTAHIDLHETTDTDNSEFRPALAARDNIFQPHWAIPDGLYLVGDSEKPAPDFQAAIINAVSEVTHIAPCDENGKIIGVDCEQEGVINYEIAKLGLATGMTDCIYSTTTEVYPDSAKITDDICIQAQVAAVCGGLNYIFDQTTV